MVHSRGWNGLRALAVLSMLATLVLLPVAGRGRSATAATAMPLFGPTTVVEDQRAGTEPGVRVCGPDATWSLDNCGQDNPYGTEPWGVSTSNSFLFRSEDQGNSFKLVPSNTPAGRPDVCVGGGDTDLIVSPGTTQATDLLDWVDMQALTNFSPGVSSNGGQSWICNSVSTAATVVDRQWLGAYRKPSDANGVVYLDYDLIADARCQTPEQSATANGNAFAVQQSPAPLAGLAYMPPVIVDCNDGTAGNLQVNQTNGHIFAIHTGYALPNPSSHLAPDTVVVNRSIDGGATWTRSTVFQPIPGTTCATDCTTGQDFAVLAIDKSGGLYAVWSQAPVDGAGNVIGPSHIYYAYSGDEGGSWTPEQQVDAGGNTDVNIFPWIAAGNAGAIDVVWYGTKRAASLGSYDSGSQTTDWYPYLSQALNANGSNATFSAPVPVSQHPNHNGGICTMGLGCTAGGDRSLGDFFQVDVNREGGADIIFNDTSNNGSNGSNQAGLTDEVRQVGGPSLFGGTVNTGPALVTCTAVGLTPCVSDPTGDARYEANGVIGNAVPKLDITGSSVARASSSSSQLDVRMTVQDLSSLPGSADTDINASDQFLDYLTTWNYHIPGHTQANYDSTGNVYYAYLEVNRATGATTAYDGNTCSTASTHPKFLTYPGQNAIVSKITGNTIDLSVPLADVGNPPVGASLYSVTAHTVGQPGPAGPFTCSTRDPNGSNQYPAGQLFDVYDKSQAYTTVITGNPTASLLRYASAAAHDGIVTFRWQVAADQRVLGYNLLVRRQGTLQRVNGRLLPWHTGRSYQYRRHLPAVSTFFVQAVSRQGRQVYGPYPVWR